MRKRLCVIALLLFQTHFIYCGDDCKIAWEARAKRLSSDSSVVRFYTFEEGKGSIVNNLGGDRTGAMCMVGYSPYNSFRGFPKTIAKPAKDYPHWTIGRWPWKKAVSCGNASPQFVRSCYHGLKIGSFSVETWVKPHALEEREWVHGNLACIPHGVWGSGWSIYAQRQHWCRQGVGGFRIGVHKGSFDVRSVSSNPFKFGKWNHLVAVYDKKEIRFYLNGKLTSKPISKEILMGKPRQKLENDVKGLQIGGNLRFVIDELVIYNRVLSQEEVNSNYKKFSPGETAFTGLNPGEVKFFFPRETEGYFPLKKEIDYSIKVPSNTKDHTAEFKVISRKENRAVQQKALVIGGNTETVKSSFIPQQYGLFDIVMSVFDKTGMLVREETFPIGVIPKTTQDSGLIIPHVEQTQPWAKDLGVEWARVVLNWRHVEPQKDLFNWEYTDRKIDTAIESGLKVLCCVTGIPKWTKRDSQNKLLPADLNRYRNFIKVVANRYRKDVSAWEIWDKPFTAPRFYFRNARKQYEILLDAAKTKLQECKSSKMVIDPAKWYAICGYRQPSAKMGNYDPGDMNSLFYKGRTITKDGQTGVSAWPFQLFPEDASVAFLITQILNKRAKGIKNILLGCTPNEYYPRWNNSDGTPSEQGLAIAALNSLMTHNSSVERLDKKGELTCFAIKSGNKTITALVNNGNKTEIKISTSTLLKGVDCLGNPLNITEKSMISFKTAVYIFGQIDIKKIVAVGVKGPLDTVKVFGGENPSVKYIQRTMKKLEAGREKVKILYYGQSITTGGWTRPVTEYLRKKYPKATLEYVHLAIGGFGSDRLKRTAYHDLYPIYPDLLVFHVYGNMKDVEEIIKNTREKTTAEIILWTHHLSRDVRNIPVDDKSAEEWRKLAEKYDCMLVDVRKKWKKYLNDTGKERKELLRDSVHHNSDGQKLLAKIMISDIKRIPSLDNPVFEKQVKVIPINSPQVKKSSDGTITLKFKGNRVDAVSDGKDQAPSTILLDGKNPSDFPEMWAVSRPSAGICWMPSIMNVSFEKVPLKQTWTLTCLDKSSPDGKKVYFKVEGSETGLEGEGVSTEDFVSKSKRVKILKKDWFLTFPLKYKKISLPKNFQITWKTYPLFTEEFIPGKKGNETILIQGIENKEHILTIKPEKGKTTGIEYFRVYTPVSNL